MSEEFKKQIIKAHIYGYTDLQIAQNEGITVSEVRSALQDKALIDETRAFMKESGWLE
jgi:DNA-directed RNA polymerase specialized sigma24 family protein